MLRMTGTFAMDAAGVNEPPFRHAQHDLLVRQSLNVMLVAP
jgi:hypothetical protein